MIKILFFMPDLNAGGAQRTVVNIVNHLDQTYFKPVLVLGHADGAYLETIRREVTVISLGKKKVRHTVIALTKQMFLQKPEILFAPYPDANVALMLAKYLSGSKGKAVLRESNNRTAQKVQWGALMQSLVRWSYRKANRVVGLSNGVRDDLIARYGLPSEKVLTIYNPVDVDMIRHMAFEEPEGWRGESGKNERGVRLIAVGRLVYQKGFDLLIRAVANLRDKGIQLTILGEGVEKDNLLQLTDKLKIQELVSMPGFKKNPYAWIHRSDLFVLSSRWEGFGHVIVEAMACGVAVLSTRCPSGPDEIITDGKDGLLCEPESVDDLTEKIGFLTDNPFERKRLAQGGQAAVLRYKADLIVKDYEQLFKSMEGGTG
jgi:glycosyltransferase involved in cell wall biosynthesis